MKKIVLIFLLFPFLGWSQRTNFTDEEIEFGDKFYERFENINPTAEEFLLEIEAALVKVPHYPYFVRSLFKAKLVIEDFKFVNDYCSCLDDNYLSTFQPILVELCAYAYFFNNDYNGLYYRIIPLIQDRDTKELFLTAYYMQIDDYGEFKKYAKYSLLRKYKYPSQMVIRDYLFKYLVGLANSNDLSAIIRDYEATIFSSELGIPTNAILIQSAIFNDDFRMAEKLIDYVKKQDTNNYKYLYPISAFFYSYKGEEGLAIEALEQALALEDSDFERIIEAGAVSMDIFNFYAVPIRRIKDSNTRERLVSQAISYFEKRAHYSLRFKLYQSLLYAPKDINKAKNVLKECEPFLEALNLTNLDHMIRMENELGKEDPNYRLVDDLTKKITPYHNSPEIHLLRTLFRYKVNYNSKQPVFSLNEMVEELDELLKHPLDRKEKLEYLHFKLLLIAENDSDWAERELEKLPEDEASEIRLKIQSVVNNPDKKHENLISNMEDLKNIKETFKSLMIINVAYISTIRLKE